MKILILALISIFLTTTGFTQDENNSYGMTPEQNVVWLTTLKHADKEEQLLSIQNRFFRQQTPLRKKENEDVPVLVINGIPVSEEMDDRIQAVLGFKLTADKVEIEVLPKEPEGLYVNKRWTGLILMTITDKKTRKQMYKQK